MKNRSPKSPPNGRLKKALINYHGTFQVPSFGGDLGEAHFFLHNATF